MKRLALLGLMLLALLAVAGCGGSSSSEEKDEEQSATPAEARDQLGQIRTLLASAVSTYKAGDHEAAEEQVGDVYLEHYEEVEGPLGERDHDLMEELEEEISTELRDKMKADAADSEIESLLEEINGNLDKAEEALR
jgi:hypothetical protein